LNGLEFALRGRTSQSALDGDRVIALN